MTNDLNIGFETSNLRLNWALAALIALCSGQAHAQVVDRVRAVVDGDVITQSDIEKAIAFNLVSEGQSGLSRHDLESMVLQQLIDQRLILRQMRGAEFPRASASEVAREFQRIRQRYGSPEEFSSALRRLGLSEASLKSLIQQKLDILKFVEWRFRPKIEVSQQEIERYYNQVFLPEANRRGMQNVPSLAEAQNDIREILVQEKINRELSDWLSRLRDNANIRVL